MKLTKEYLEELIDKAIYIHSKESSISCVLKLTNGIEVIGKYEFSDTETFDMEKGKSRAYKQAFEKLWELEDYHIEANEYEDQYYKTIEEELESNEKYLKYLDDSLKKDKSRMFNDEIAIYKRKRQAIAEYIEILKDEIAVNKLRG